MTQSRHPHAAAQQPIAEFIGRYWAHRQPYDRGGSALDYWSAVAGTTPSEPGLQRLVSLDMASWLSFDPEMVQMLGTLRAAGTPLSLLSNAPRELADALIERPELTSFRHLLFSADLRLTKPEPEIFRKALARIGMPASDVVFIDDRPENTAAAAALGIRTITYTPTPAARDAIIETLTDDRA